MSKRKEYIDLSIDALNTELLFQQGLLFACDEINDSRKEYRNQPNIRTFVNWFATVENLYFLLSNYGRTTFSQKEDYGIVTNQIETVRKILPTLWQSAAIIRQSNNSSNASITVPDILCTEIENNLGSLMRNAMAFQQSGSTEDQAGAAGIGAFLKAAQKELEDKAKLEAENENK